MSWLSRFVDKNITHKTERRKAAEAIQSQIDFYQSQKRMADEEVARIRGEEEAEKRRLDEKKVRVLKRKFRNPGFLEEAVPEMREKLG
jgi:hypothetical protein